MRKLRLITVATVAAALATTGIAQASSGHTAKKKHVKPVCNLIKATANTAVPPSLQILSGDVASNKKMVTMAIRVTKLAAYPDASAPLGRDWTMTFNSGPQVAFEVTSGPFGTQTNIPGRATLDTAKNEVRLSISVKTLQSVWPTAQFTPGRAVFTGITATARTVVQSPVSTVTHQTQMGGYLNFNQAVSPRSYLAGSPSCLKVGS